VTTWVDGLEEQARGLLPEAVFRYFSQGSGAGLSAAEACQAWEDMRFLPRVMRDVSKVSVSTTVLGTPLDVPVALAPTTLQRQAHPGGEVEMARGAANAGTLVCVSSNSGSTFAVVAEAGAPWWVQAYVLKDRGLTTAMLERAVAAGARAVVLTADTPVVAVKHEGPASVWDLVPGEHLHANEDLAGVRHSSLEKAMDLTPDTIGWLAEVTGLPVVVKGILRADDATIALAAGAAGVWVSNHGGRQLDRSIATARALGPVADAVGGGTPVFVDGGVRHGLDVLAALALGAQAVFIGRPALWALAVSGADGVTRLVGTIRAELEEAMRLAGVTDAGDVRAARLVDSEGPPVRLWHRPDQELTVPTALGRRRGDR
jgi:4-hydroxymandelate oxidase